ncbi:PREDICTED: lck-interacting transmembrane adapter 1 isoform X3 [Chinchilla lanigera]|nr:PREDICTED: lck-interacting transmembrane adapter 1 isoform X3 [Chinchilla lanigera]XP_013362901.1 PREDICTED: lck-interacting transmembrane adapter 1 isoform X3 [Chinchilla lanigera]
MGPPVPVSLPALWVLGCFSLLLWLWALCTACHRKQVQSHQAKRQDTVMLAEAALLRQTHLCSLSTSDTRLHELHHGTRVSKALRPASMDLLHSHWLEVSRSSSRPQAAPSVFPPQQPGAPSASAITLSTGPGATYSNVGLPAIPRASLAASPVVWAGTQLTPGPGARPVLAEYASIQKLRGTDPGPQELQQGKAKVMPAAQVDVLYSRVCKPKIKDLGPTADHPDCMGTEAILALERDLAYEPLPLRRLGMDSSPLENVYESIREVGARASPEPPSLPLSIRGHSRPPRPLGKVWRPLS